MLDYTQTRAGDVRALTQAILLGSGAGLIIGVVYLAGSGGRVSSVPAPEAPRSSPAAAAASALPPSRPIARRASAAAPAVRLPFAAIAQAPGLQALRDRIRLASIELRKPAEPFHAEQGADADLHCLAEAVYFEARGEEQPGQQAVAQVVLNRVRHPAFPKTICAVVHQRTAGGCQFSFACGGRQAQTGSAAWRRAETVATAEMHGAVMTAVGDATHFQSARAGAFSGLLKVAQIGAHVFYRFTGHAGAASMFQKSPAPPIAPPVIQLANLDAPAFTLQAGPAVDPVKPAPATGSMTAAAASKPTLTGARPLSPPAADPKPAAPSEAAGRPPDPAPAAAAQATPTKAVVPVATLARS